MGKKAIGTQRFEALDTGEMTSHRWEKSIGYALRNLGDRSVLNRSPLAKLVYIERLASAQFSGHLLPRGLALHDVLLACVEGVKAEVGEQPGLSRACKYLELLASGLNCREIASQMGLSREHISRVYRRKALGLLTEKFLSTVTNGGQPESAAQKAAS